MSASGTGEIILAIVLSTTWLTIVIFGVAIAAAMDLRDELLRKLAAPERGDSKC